MEIDKLLHVAENTPLKMYVWGSGVADTLNRLLPPTHQITIEITGGQALELIRALPPAAITAVMGLELDISTGQAKGDVPAPTVPAVPKPEERKSKFLIWLGVLFAFIAVMITVVISANAWRSGTAPDEGVLKLLLQTFLEVLKAFTTPPAPVPTP